MTTISNNLNKLEDVNYETKSKEYFDYKIKDIMTRILSSIINEKPDNPVIKFY